MIQQIKANPRLFIGGVTAAVNLTVIGLSEFASLDVSGQFVAALNAFVVAATSFAVGDNLADREVSQLPK